MKKVTFPLALPLALLIAAPASAERRLYPEVLSAAEGQRFCEDAFGTAADAEKKIKLLLEEKIEAEKSHCQQKNASEAKIKNCLEKLQKELQHSQLQMQQNKQLGESCVKLFRERSFQVSYAAANLCVKNTQVLQKSKVSPAKAFQLCLKQAAAQGASQSNEAKALSANETDEEAESFSPAAENLQPAGEVESAPVEANGTLGSED